MPHNENVLHVTYFFIFIEVVTQTTNVKAWAAAGEFLLMSGNLTSAWFQINRRWSLIIRTNLNIQTSIAQKLYSEKADILPN